MPSFTIRWRKLCLESDMADHITEVRRDALQHFSGCKRFHLVLLQAKDHPQCRILYTFNL